MGVVAPGVAARAGARRLESPAYPQQEPRFHREREEALGEQQEPPRMHAGEVSDLKSTIHQSSGQRNYCDKHLVKLE